MTYKEYAKKYYGDNLACEKVLENCPEDMFEGKKYDKVELHTREHCYKTGCECDGCWNTEMLFEPKGDK